MILYSYIIREIIKYTGMVLAVVVGIYLLIDFFERIDNFIEAGLPISRTLIYLCYKIPFIIAQIMPIAVLLAILITIGLMNKHNEITALRSSGISVFLILKPVIGVGIFFTIFLFVFSELIVPISSSRANHIWLQEVRKKAAVISKDKNIWIKDNHLIINIKYYNKKEQTINGLILNYFDKDFRVSRRIDAKKGVFKKNIWVLHNLMDQVLDKDTGQYKIQFHQQLSLTLNFSPESLQTVVKKSEEMNFNELYEYVKKVESEGYDATFYKVDLHAKAAFPFICIILSIVGISIGSRRIIKEGLPVGIAYGIGITFLYWVFYSFCISLGYGGMLPPVVAAWAANLVFSCFAIFLLLNAEYK